MTLPTPGRYRPMMFRQLFTEDDEDCRSSLNLDLGPNANANVNAGGNDLVRRAADATGTDWRLKFPKQKLNITVTDFGLHDFGSTLLPNGNLRLKRIKLDPSPSPDMKNSFLQAIPTPPPSEDTGSRSCSPLMNTSPVIFCDPDTFFNETPKIRLKLRKQDIFISAVGEWYKELAPLKKKTLTRKELKRKAVAEAFILNLETKRIPADWLEILHRDFGVECYARRKNLGGFPQVKRKKKQPKLALTPAAPAVTTPNCGGVDNRNAEGYYTSSGRRIKQPEVLNIGTCVRDRASDKIVESGRSLSHFDADVCDGSKDQRTRKLVDLSDQLPPAWWIEQRNKTGIAPPRELVVTSTWSGIVIFYEYGLPPDYYSRFGEANPDLIDSTDRGGKQVKYAHDANGFKWPECSGNPKRGKGKAKIKKEANGD